MNRILNKEKVDIQDEKVDIESVLLEKRRDFSPKTTIHIRRLFEKYSFDKIFGRSEVMSLLGIKLPVHQSCFLICYKQILSNR